MTMSTEIPRDEVRAALHARDELAREYEPAVVEAFAERVEREIDARVDARLARMRDERPARSPSGPGTGSIVLALGSMGLGIGATGAATGMGGSEGVVVAIVVWIAIALINVANAARR
jgi:hypothetical protein